jgi:hypothetical protein
MRRRRRWRWRRIIGERVKMGENRIRYAMHIS